MSGRQKISVRAYRVAALLGTAVVLLLALVSVHRKFGPWWRQTTVPRTHLDLHSCATKACNLVILGDSFAICDDLNCRGVGPVVSTNRWAEQVRIALQAKYGSGGTGILPTNVGYLAADMYNALNAEAWSCTGPHDFNTSSLHVGPATSMQNAVLHLGSGAICKFRDQRGIVWGANVGGYLNTYYVTTPSSGTLTVAVDGGIKRVVEQATTTTPTAGVSQLPVLSAGPHTAIYSSQGDTYLYGAEGTSGPTGFRVHNLALSGTNSTIMNSNEKLAFIHLIPTGVQASIIGLYTNDVNVRTVPADYARNIKATIAGMHLPTTPLSVLFILPPVTGAYPKNAQLPYTVEALKLCHTELIACVNIQDRWGRTYTDADHRWAFFHPNDKGNLDEAAIIRAALQ